MITTDLLKIPEGFYIRKFTESDFDSIQRLYEKEGWMTFIKKSEDALLCWKNSTIALVVLREDEVVGLLRALSDGWVTTYICEIIVDKKYRGKGIGKALIEVVHQLYPKARIDLLSSESSYRFYEQENFRNISGFRKSYY